MDKEEMLHIEERNNESPCLLYKRVSKAVIELLDDNRDKEILLVTHGVIAIILCLVHGLYLLNK